MSSTEEAKNLTLRIKCKASQNIVLRDISPFTKISEFLPLLSSKTQIPVEKIRLLSGFPPRPLILELERTLAECGILNSDTIIVEGESVHPIPLSKDHHIHLLKSPPLTTASVGSNTVTRDKSFNLANNTEIGSSSSNNEGTSSSSGRPNNDDESGVVSGVDYDIPIGLQGIMVRRVVPSDNSCLFSAISFCIYGSVNDSNPRASEELREVIATTILSDSVKYNEGYLGRSNLEYVEWISRFDSWGGGIELSILSSHFGVEIDVMDTQHVRVNMFGEDRSYGTRIFLIYDGTHYDPLCLEPYNGGKTVTMFPKSDSIVFEQVMELGKEAHMNHQYTDISNFSIRCSECGTYLVGASDANAHAKQTGHTNYTEVIH